MARSKPGPIPKRGLLTSRTLDSLNLSQDIIILDTRLKSGPASDAEGAIHMPKITRLSGVLVQKRTKIDLKPRWGNIDPATEDPDEIIQLFDEWRQYSCTNSTRVEKTRKRKRYPREYKLKALVFWRHGVVLKKSKKHDSGSATRPEWERISQNQAASVLEICAKQLREWKNSEEDILESVKGSRQITRTGQAKWPEMEVQLHLEFKEARKLGRSINRKWFGRVGRRIFAELYPDQIGFDECRDSHVVFDCTFSDGWFSSFKKRWSISWRCKTNTASKPPEDYRPKISLFCKFNRRNSQLRFGDNPEFCDVGRYPLGNMFNMDQTPFPFEFLTGRTYDIRGNKTVWEKALRASWGKRQATLQITICADGKKRCRPLLIFRGLGATKTMQAEITRYDPRVRAIFNAKGYSNENVTLEWLEKDLIPSCAFPNKPRFIALDVFAGQKTTSVLTAFRASKTVTSFIPEGCTALVQPLDTAVNKTIKAKISELLNQEMDKNFEFWESGKFTIGDRRILMTWVVGKKI